MPLPQAVARAVAQIMWAPSSVSSSAGAASQLSLNPTFMTGPRYCAQLVLADLAGGCSGQVEHEVNVLGRLELRNPLLDMTDQFRLPRGLSRGQHHEGLRSLTPPFVGNGDDGDVGHRRMGGEGLFDLNRGDVLAAGDHDVLGPVHQPDVAVGIAHTEIAGVEPVSYTH